MRTQDSDLLQMYSEQFGPVFRDMALTVYVNFYFSELEIMDLCGRWIPRRTDVTEKSYLIKHASDEVEHAAIFRKGVERLGVAWTDDLVDQYRIQDIDDRFSSLHQSDDELKVLVGLNCYAEGVLAMEELVQLGDRYPDIFPDFHRVARDEFTHVAFGRTVLKRYLSEDPANVRRAQTLVDEYRDHVLSYLWTELGDKIDLGIHFGALSPQYRENTLHRFDEVMKSVGLHVEWPTDKQPIAPTYQTERLNLPRIGAMA